MKGTASAVPFFLGVGRTLLSDAFDFDFHI